MTGPWFEGRYYDGDDLHKAALVLMSRRHGIQKTILRDFAYLDPVGVAAILRSVEFLATCEESYFSKLEEAD